MSWTQGEAKHTSNGSKVTQITLEMMGQTKKKSKGYKRKMPIAYNIKPPKNINSKEQDWL